jgi:hypothetical protein
MVGCSFQKKRFNKKLSRGKTLIGQPKGEIKSAQQGK